MQSGIYKGLIGVFVVSSIILLLISPMKSNAAQDSEFHALEITGGTFFGPGQLIDSPLPKGRLGYIRFRKFLTGQTEYFNNGSEPPNLESELVISGSADGLMSNGQPFNEHVEGGVADVGKGALQMMVVIAANGPNKGCEIYELQEDYNWKITTDLAMDPGFPEGLVISSDLFITTGLRIVPKSLQTKNGLEGGVDRAGTLPSGLPVVGSIGDYDMDGFLDGSIVGASNIPLNHIFLAGAPVVQRRDFVSNIPIEDLDAALLTLASIGNYTVVWDQLRDNKSVIKDDPVRDYTKSHLQFYIEDVNRRWKSGGDHIGTAKKNGSAKPKTLYQASNLMEARLADLKRVVDWSKEDINWERIPTDIDRSMRDVFETARKVVKMLAPLSSFMYVSR